MGAGQLDLTSLELGRTVDIALPLQDPSRCTTPLGEILLAVTLYPKTQEDKEQVTFYVYLIKRIHFNYILNSFFFRSVTL